MRPFVLADTGPLVAFLDRSDQHHEWAKGCFSHFTEPLFTCEAVIAETLFLLRRGGIAPSPLLELITRSILVPSFTLRDQADGIRKLMEKYSNIPMSLADACLVEMSNTSPNAKVFTLNSDFSIYRRSNRRVIQCISPDC